MRQFLEKLPMMVRYLLAGGTSTAVDLGILYVLTEYAGWWYLTSATAAFVVAVVVSFLLQKFYTFAHRDVSRTIVATQSALFLALQITNIGINTLFMYALVEWADVWYFAAQIIAAASIAVESFFVYRFVIFHPSAPLANLVTHATRQIRRHRTALVVASLISLLYGAHHFLMPRFMPDGLVYKPVTYESDPDAGGYYGPRANAFFSRNDIPLPSFLPMLNPLIIGGLGKVFGSMERAYVVSDFLFPPLIFFVVYLLSCEVVRRRLPALFLSSVFIVSPLAALLSPYVPIFAEPTLLYFSSFEYPKVTFLFYALALLFIFRALQRSNKKNIILAGIFFGVLFYTYLYDWAYLTVALFVALVWFAVRREWSVVKSCAYIFGIGGVISIPYWLNFVALHRLPHYNDLMFRIGGIETGRQFRFVPVWKTYVRHLVWIAALAVTTLRRVPRTAIFLIALLAAYFIVVNVQVVLGFSPQPDHWYRETFLPVFLSLGAVSVWFWDKYFANHISKKSAITACAIFLVLFFAQAFYGQYILSRDSAIAWGVERRYANAYTWLYKNTEAGSVVGSLSEETTRDILLFSHNALFLQSGGTTLVSNEEIWKRLYALSALWELTPEQFGTFVRNKTYYLFQSYFHPRAIDSYFKTTKLWPIPEEELAARRLAFTLARRDIVRTTPYPLDYLFVGPREESITRVPSTFGNLQLVYDAGGVRVYRLNYENRK